MGICSWLILGGIAGWLASIVAGNNARQGLIGNIVVGIIGAFIGGFVFTKLGGADITGFNIYSLAVATVGGVILLVIKGVLTGKR